MVDAGVAGAATELKVEAVEGRGCLIEGGGSPDAEIEACGSYI